MDDWLRKGIWWAQDYAWVAMAWLATLGAPADPARYATGPGRPVVIIPGVYENWQFLRPLILPLHEHGHPVHVVPALGHNLLTIEAGARAVLDFLDRTGLSGVTLVAHSKGGLIGKQALAWDTGGRIDGLVAICTPFGGSSRVKLLPLPSLRHLAPGAVPLAALAAHVHLDQRITSVYGLFDEHIPEGSELPGARNVQVPVPGHFQILGRPQTVNAVLAGIAAGAPADGPKKASRH